MNRHRIPKQRANPALLPLHLCSLFTASQPIPPSFVKASAVEPQWQDRWERQLAGYSAASQRVINIGNSGSQAVQLISKISLGAILFFGAKEVIAGALTVGGLVAFNMFAQRVSGPVSGGARSRAEARAKILGDLAKAASDASLRREELIKSTQRSSLQRLLSPVDGTIAQLAVHTVGGVVEAAKPIMVVVPSGDSLIVEAKVLNKDMGFVSIGQPVAVKLEAFPFTRFGTVPGTITSIGSDAVEDEKLGLVYTVRVKLARSTMPRGDTVVALTPGMAATADIKTGRRSILSYLVSPIDEARLSAGRER